MYTAEKKDEGSVLLIVAAVSGILVVMILFAMDVGHYYIVKMRMQNLVDSVTDAGAGVIGDEIIKIAEPRMRALKNPPSKDPLYYLNDSERQNLVYGPSSIRIKQVMLDAELNNLRLYNLKSDQVVFTTMVPAKNIVIACDGVNSSFAPLRAEGKTSVPIIFGPLARMIGKEDITISVNSATTVSLCPNPLLTNS